MICADRKIILLNKRLDKENRMNVYIPTEINGVSVYDIRQSSSDGGFHSETEKFKVRIPINAQVLGGKTYLPETHYDSLADNAAKDYWTLHNEDLMIICDSGSAGINCPTFQTDTITRQQAYDLADSIGFQKEVIEITDYSDNTLRGSVMVKHWRIGGV